jgi:hypothetical protein
MRDFELWTKKSKRLQPKRRKKKQCDCFSSFHMKELCCLTEKKNELAADPTRLRPCPSRSQTLLFVDRTKKAPLISTELTLFFKKPPRESEIFFNFFLIIF